MKIAHDKAADSQQTKKTNVPTPIIYFEPVNAGGGEKSLYGNYPILRANALDLVLPTILIGSAKPA